MIAKILGWLNDSEADAGAKNAEELTVPIATAVLYYEVLRADAQFSNDEIQAYEQKVLTEFGFAREQLAPFLQKVEAKAKDAVDYMQFTRLIHENCSLQQKRHILTSLWHLAMADGQVDPHEEHLIRKMADLMYLSHADFIQCRMSAEQSATAGK
ncbi:tellurite resistance TerB family protein [Planctobacterium marinum]|uniref:tellurite resistance TerB family protein n=1 Tax=Planctobacterium marinum TaxID=1631968 RepID=UPI001E3B80D5|nr:TerB family tellurite resistance protein [Planctobacterium marinum]MCC2604477.1 TerB family tellurite resistance protein [Planctobacterium marinum]